MAKHSQRSSLIYLASVRLTRGGLQRQSQPCQLAVIAVGESDPISLSRWLSALDIWIESAVDAEKWRKNRNRWDAEISEERRSEVPAQVVLWWWQHQAKNLFRGSFDGVLTRIDDSTFSLVVPKSRHPADGVHLLKLIIQNFNRLFASVLSGASPSDLVSLRDDWIRKRSEFKWSSLSWNTVLLRQAADRKGIPWWPLKSGVDQFGWGMNGHRFLSTHSDNTGVLAQQLAKNKSHVNEMLRDAGLPVAKQGVAVTAEECVALARQIGFPVVVKPATRDFTNGVSVNLGNDDAVIAGFNKARDLLPLLVEAFIEGTEYRITVVKGQIVGVHERTSPTITGDGIRSVSELIFELNADTRRTGYPYGLVPIAVDDDLHALLKTQGCSIDSIPSSGQVLRLLKIPLTVNGGIPFDRLSSIHPENASLISRAVRLVGLDIAGVDFIIPDIKRSWRDSHCAILEVNSQPLLISDYLADLSGNLYGRLLEILFDGGDGRIPVVALGGHLVATETTKALKDLLWQRGERAVGIATSEGAWLDEEPLATNGVDGVGARDVLLIDPATKIALISCAATGLLAEGHPCDRYAVTVLAELDQSGDQRSLLIQMKAWSELIQRTTQTVIVNTDIPLLKSLAQRLDNLRLIGISTTQSLDTLKPTLPEGALALVSIEGGMQLWDGAQMTIIPVARSSKPSLSFLAAYAAALALGMTAKEWSDTAALPSMSS